MKKRMTSTAPQITYMLIMREDTKLTANPSAGCEKMVLMRHAPLKL